MAVWEVLCNGFLLLMDSCNLKNLLIINLKYQRWFVFNNTAHCPNFEAIKVVLQQTQSYFVLWRFVPFLLYLHFDCDLISTFVWDFIYFCWKSKVGWFEFQFSFYDGTKIYHKFAMICFLQENNCSKCIQHPCGIDWL